jgi:hypothetical protein
MIYDMPWLFNFGKLPVCCVEGCHNSQFNVTLFYTFFDKDNSKHSWGYGLPVPECWSWWLTRKIAGGSLATIGNTGLGVGAVGEHGDLDNDGILEPDILEAFGGLYFDQFYLVFDEGNDILGDCHGGALFNYLEARPGMGYQIDAKTMEQMALIGDPSLKIGGYSSNNGFTAEIVDAAAGVLGSPDEEIMFQASAFNGQGEITYNWDFDNDGEYDEEGEVASWSWNLPGAYWIKLKATDKIGESDYYDTLVAIQFGASKPAKPSGQTNIKAGVEYTYTTTVNTQSGYWNHVYYKFSWGDGTETDWIETPSASHSWNKKSRYEVKVKALLTHESTRDQDDAEDFKETEWSDPLAVSLPRSKSIPKSFIQLLQYFFENYPNAFPLLRLLLQIFGLQ